MIYFDISQGIGWVLSRGLDYIWVGEGLFEELLSWR